VRLVEIELDGRKLLVSPERTILEVAAAQGVRIPTLCHDPRLDPYAACWVCLVRVSGAKGFVPACATKVRQGMRICTNDADVRATRRMALELILSNHYGDCRAPCTLTCPSNIDVQGYVALIANGRHREALQLIRRDNPFPAATGRVCPRPCETACRRNLVDEPVAIDWLKRYVADLELTTPEGPPQQLPPVPRTGKRVAVIGAGPAGLSAAYYLAQAGVAVTVFEAQEKAGGMFRYGIPDYRLPQDVLDREIQGILRLGVELETGVRLGAGLTLDELRARFDAVILAYGAWKSHTLRIQGENRPGILAGIDFLHAVATGKAVDLGAVVAVIGGGNTAIDSARTAVRLGAREVNLFYRRTDVEMPASPAEVREAVEEGVAFYYLTAPVMVQESGRGLKSLRLIKMELGEPDASGRRRPVPVEGTEFEKEVDTIITAIGQYSDLSFLASVPGLLDGRGNLLCDEQTGITPVPGVFAAGDLVSGADIAIRAIAGGKHAARAVAAYLGGEAYRRPWEFLSKKEEFGKLTTEDYREEPRIPRQPMAVLEPQERKTSFAEIEQGYTEEQARREAARCLECGCQDVEECRLKEYAGEYGANPLRYAGEIQRHPIDESHPYISRDAAKCILCGRCIRACLELQGLGVLGYMWRGFRSVVAPTFGVPLGEDPLCISCGQCVSACPVGALTEKLPGGKTAPLPERVEEGFCALCSLACPVELRYHGGLLTRVTPRSVAGANGGPPVGGRLCAKGKFQHGFLGARAGDGAGTTGAAAGGAGARAAGAAPGSALDSRGRGMTPQEARRRLQRLLAEARSPLLRLSPYLSGEAIDAFLELARRRELPVVGAGLEELEPGWEAFTVPPKAGSGECCLFEGGAGGGGRQLLLLGNLDQSNNVAFTECLAMARRSGAVLWHAGALAPVYERFFARCEDGGASRALPARAKAGGAGKLAPALGPVKLRRLLRDALQEAGEGGRLEVLLNPSELLREWGKEMERHLLRTLRNMVRPAAAGSTGAAVRVTLFWNARNAGYLLRALHALRGGATSGRRAAAGRGGPPEPMECDLILEAGPQGELDDGVRWKPPGKPKRVQWGVLPTGAHLFIPLSPPLLMAGYGEPSGRSPFSSGELGREALCSLLLD
jgi:NADPH-dependent glutamate synthase beta subunit-like oxidoreductase/ferredoxin